MGKQSRTNRRLNARATPPRRPRGLDSRVRLGIAAGMVVALAVVLTAAAFAFAISLRPADTGSLPQGTQVFAENDHTHVNGPVTYDRVPPAGGAHNPVQLNCGVYNQTVPNENAVHSLEHGAVWITYQPTLPADQVGALQQFVTTHYVGGERYLILSPYAGLPSPIVATAWGAQLGVDSVSDSRLAQFVKVFAGGGQGGEPGGPCTGGTGSPVE